MYLGLSCFIPVGKFHTSCNIERPVMNSDDVDYEKEVFFGVRSETIGTQNVSYFGLEIHVWVNVLL